MYVLAVHVLFVCAANVCNRYRDSISSCRAFYMTYQGFFQDFGQGGSKWDVTEYWGQSGMILLEAKHMAN